MSLRLLHVSQPVDAGVPAVVRALVADQLGRGHDVHVASPDGPGLAVTVRALGATHHAWAANRSPGPTVPGEARRLRAIVKRVDPDVVVLHSAKAGLAGRLALRGHRPTIYVPHSWSFNAVHGVVANAATTWEVGASRWTDVVVCVSEDERERGLAAGVTAPMRVVTNGVDLELLQPRDRHQSRARLGLPERPTVVCVGRLAEQKGQDLLLAAWPPVRETLPEAQLILVGDGPQRTALEAMATDGVMFVGDQPDPREYFAAADVVAVPSRWEGGPLVPLEAMAMARPVVGFAADGMRATIGDTGFVLEPGDVPGLAARLIRLLSTPEVAAAAGRAARRRVLRLADVRQGLAAWDDIVTEVAGLSRVLERVAG